METHARRQMEERRHYQQQTQSICSDLSSLLDDLSFSVSSNENENSYVYPACLKQTTPAAALVTPNQSNSMELPNGNNAQYFPLEESFSDLLGSDNNLDLFAQNAFESQPEHGRAPKQYRYPMSRIHYPGPNDVMFGRYVKCIISLVWRLHESILHDFFVLLESF